MARDEYFDPAAEGRRPMSDFEWYATDRAGNVAFLTSAGFGPIPLDVFRDRADYYEAAHWFRALPDRSQYVRIGTGPYDLSSWTKAAAQGLFGYDWNASAGQYIRGYPYKLIAAPKRPISLQDLPPAARDWIAPIRFDVEFGLAAELFVERQFSEVNL